MNNSKNTNTIEVSPLLYSLLLDFAEVIEEEFNIIIIEDSSSNDTEETILLSFLSKSDYNSDDFITTISDFITDASQVAEIISLATKIEDEKIYENMRKFKLINLDKLS